MHALRTCITLLWFMLLPGLSLAGSAVTTEPSSDPCPKVAPLPERPADAPTGQEFAHDILDLSGLERDAQILEQLEKGNIPAFLRHLIPVTLEGTTAHGTPASITVCVLPDYLAVGSDLDYLYVPLGLKSAFQMAWRHGYMLPTPRLVDAIYAASAVKLKPEPLPASDQMRSTAYVMRHTDLIHLQRGQHPEAPADALTAGDKKDVVLSALIWRVPGRVAIYGWHRALGDPIQPLSTVHGEHYVDYSHGVRLVSRTVYVNGAGRRMDDVLADHDLAPLLSAEGPLPHLGQRLAKLLTRNGP